MLDIIISQDAPQLTKTTLKLALEGLRGINVIEAPSLKEGLPQTRAEFVSFVGEGLLDSKHFKDNLQVFLDQPKFKKLAMVSTAVANRSLEDKCFGFTLEPTGLVPVDHKSSSLPYALQIGYLPGAILRRSSVEHVAQYLTGNAMQDSYQASIDFWLTGKMCYINPAITYVDLMFGHEEPVRFNRDPWKNHEQMQQIKKMWKREVIA